MTDRKVRLQFLGSFAAFSGAEDVTAAIAQPKRLALLIWLELSRPRGLHSRDTLCGLLWPESPNDKARAALRQLLLVLRRDLGEDVFVSEGELVGINAERVTSDAGTVLDALEHGDDARAVAAFAGELLPGLPFAEGDHFERWLEQRRSDLRRAVVQAAWREVERAESRSDFVEALRLAEWAIATDPADEQGLRRVMTLQAQHGDRTAALRAYRRYADHLRQDWDAEPEEQTRLLYERIKDGDLALAPADAVHRGGPDAPRPAPPSGQETGRKEVAPARRRLGRRLVGLGVTVLVAAIAVGFWARGARKSPANNRVVLLPFENRTGDPAWDHLSKLAGDHVTQSLLRTGLVQMVPMTLAEQVTRALRAQPEASAAALPQRVARETGAAWALSGAYYMTGDSLRFLVELTDAVGEELLASLDPVLAGTKDPMQGIERLGQSIAGSLAIWVNPASQSWAPMVAPSPSYEIEKLMQEGTAAFLRGDFRESVKQFQQAFALDTTFESARMWQGIAWLNWSEWDEADSAIRLSEVNRARLGHGERSQLAWLRAELDGDRQAAYRIVKAQTELTASLARAYMFGFEANKLGRYREALEILALVDPTAPEMDGVWTYWGSITEAHHLLGQYDQSLAAARKARNQYPDLLTTLWYEAQALAALGRADEVKHLLDQGDNLPPQPRFTPGLLAMRSGLEFRAHGDSVAAEKAFGRAVSWYEGRPDSERGSDLMRYGEALYYAREFAKAGEVLERACSTTPNTPECLGWAGVVKARMGHRDQALALRDAIGRIDSTPRGRIRMQAYHQARISAAVGDREGAVGLLRRAFAHGLEQSYDDPHIHVVYDFRTLLDYAPFKELTKPRD